MDTQDLLRRILNQRMNRYPDVGPSLGPGSTARFRQEGLRLRVGFATIPAHAATSAIAAAQASARTHGQEVYWVTVPERPGEEYIAPALAAAGFTLSESLLLMAHEGPITAVPNPAVQVSLISSWQAMYDYEYGSQQIFFSEAQPSPVMVMQRARDRWREQEHGWCRYYKALLDAAMIGGCYISLFEDIPTIMGVYTLPQARNHGVATALLARTIEDVVRQGRNYTCLFVRHGNPAEKLYRQLGFVPLTTENAYVWAP